MAKNSNSLSDEKIEGASGGKVQKSGEKYNILDNDSNEVVTSYDNSLDAEKGDLLYHSGKKTGELDGYYKGYKDGMDRVMNDVLKHKRR